MLLNIATVRAVSASSAAAHHPPTELDTVALFGFVCVFLTIVFSIYQHESRAVTFALAACLLASAVYAMLIDSWAMAFIAIAWSVTTIRRLLLRGNSSSELRRAPRRLHRSNFVSEESRITRMFGST